MAVAEGGGRRRGGRGGLNYWPGFVDALSTLLLVIIFLLSFFVLSQFFIAQELTGRDQVLQRLNRQIADLTDLLALERSNRRGLEDSIAGLRSTLAQAEGEQARLRGQIEAGAGVAGRATELGDQLATERRNATAAAQQIELLNQQIAALRRQLAALEAALDASEARDRESQARVADLGSRLNVALAQRVQELARYRSDFFGRLRQILGNRPDVRIVGDRFVFQSELFFNAGSSALKTEASPELDRIASALLDLDKQIPADIPWVMRVDGHTDVRPITTAQFPSNWALSAARAIAVVQYLVSRGVPPQRLVAAGFGEFQPLDMATTDDAFARNRRIELKLTER
ncbi:MAG TPA: peptidoglycan -binding protein [Salinarimonas sp.]|nr:peptidoglycan -binding protein [Salinarimonas sp.]